MNRLLTAIIVSLVLMGSAAAEEHKLFVAALSQKVDATDEVSAPQDVTIIESFAGAERSYAVFRASDEPAMRDFLAKVGIESTEILPVEFINSPVVGGGTKAGPTPRAGNQVYVIERQIPGVGGLPLEKKQKISMASNWWATATGAWS